MSKQEIEDFLDERLVKMSEMVSDQLINLKETLGTEIVNSTMLSVIFRRLPGRPH